MHGLVHTLTYVNAGAYIALALVSASVWRRRRARAAFWAAAAFGSLALLEVLALAVPNGDTAGERVVARVEVLLFVLFPFLLFRFTAVFRRSGARLTNALSVLTAVLVVWTCALPSLPRSGERWGPGFAVYVAVFLVHWTILALLATVQLWRAGRGQPSTARRRMRLFAFAAAAITVAIQLDALGASSLGAQLGAQIAGVLAVAGFYLALSPPTVVRYWWRAPEQARLQAAVVDLLKLVTSPQDVATRILEPAAALVAARSVVLRDRDGTVLGRWPADGRVAAAADGADAEALQIPLSSGSLEVVTSPYAPFFGDEEVEALRTLGLLTDLALDRARLRQAEQEMLATLQRADEMKTNFVAMAAHELRTPMTSIIGFAKTLDHRRDELDAEAQVEIGRVLIEQAERMAALIEHLLDLSRLDARTIAVEPVEVDLAEQLEQIVRAAVGEDEQVEIAVADSVARVRLDPDVLDRVVGNLVGNAIRYGAPPVRVEARAQADGLEIDVEDSGSGVDPEFVPHLFERFSRGNPGGHSRGTGLGLAIADAYARAHGGRLAYRRQPGRGACFTLTLPGVGGQPSGSPAEAQPEGASPPSGPGSLVPIVQSPSPNV